MTPVERTTDRRNAKLAANEGFNALLERQWLADRVFLDAARCLSVVIGTSMFNLVTACFGSPWMLPGAWRLSDMGAEWIGQLTDRVQHSTEIAWILILGTAFGVAFGVMTDSIRRWDYRVAWVCWMLLAADSVLFLAPLLFGPPWPSPADFFARALALFLIGRAALQSEIEPPSPNQGSGPLPSQ